MFRSYKGSAPKTPLKTPLVRLLAVSRPLMFSEPPQDGRPQIQQAVSSVTIFFDVLEKTIDIYDTTLIHVFMEQCYWNLIINWRLLSWFPTVMVSFFASNIAIVIRDSTPTMTRLLP
jgi:hypothetical protein